MNDYDLKACESIESIRDREMKKKVEEKLLAEMVDSGDLSEARKVLDEAASRSSKDNAIFTEAAAIILDLENILKGRSFKLAAEQFDTHSGLISLEVTKD